MQAKVQFLNVGWGDAHLIRHPSGAVTLIDGGDGNRSPDQDHPEAWMTRNGIDKLDWMILTHIHEDHQNGLLDIAKRKTIGRAVLPYEPFELPEEKLIEQTGSPMALRVYRMLASYLELIAILQEQGTEIIWRSSFGSEDRSVVWSEDGMTLRHLYPWHEDPLPGYETIVQAAQAEPAAADRRPGELLESFFDLSNHDSSVYSLSADGQASDEAAVLFGGDQLEPGWRRLSQRSSLAAQVWKVSHHGLSDGFNADILAWIRPQHCVIPIHAEQSKNLLPEWNRLRSVTEAPFHLTGDMRPGENRVIVRGTIQIEIGY
ncbi:ComEC/Rec2 family competence protein [Paenibacillus piri]|uniref:MBL fold metallo-hydrolase n=1 Tax=Paenibacillus piri TaxID=2547395 RepID=A0A4R5KKN0_9BACL|nr:MBL fold metallo-hydrolase [Paenibacillus piri]TDF95415.1 MBL fold metallo-hydrolase [Paenibacillus piri]